MTGEPCQLVRIHYGLLDKEAMKQSDSCNQEITWDLPLFFWESRNQAPAICNAALMPLVPLEMIPPA